MQSEQSLKYFNTGLISLFLLLQFALWAGDKNVFDLYHLNNTIDQTKNEIEQLTNRNDQFLAEVLDLKNGGQAVETLARQELGFIKEGETIYQVISK